MSSARRRINSTGRRKIPREHIDIRMLEALPGEPLKATANLDLEGLRFPGEALISIEAYHRSSGMRFECGTVVEPAIPPVLVLDKVDRSGSALFRLKIIDATDETGRVLGSAERIQPRSSDEGDGRRSFFPLQYRDLGPQVWKVEIIDGDRPRLIINNRIAGFQNRLMADPLVQGLLLPAALKIVLSELVRDQDFAEDDDVDNWKADWFRYCKDELGHNPADVGTDEEQRAEWIDEAIRKFCAGGSFIERIRKFGEVA